MYYYIFESSSTNNKINDLEDKIRDHVANLGIAGEMTAPSHARSLEYLIVQAKEKNYSTVVAVGGIGHITSIAHKIAGSNIVLGIIPVGSFPDLNSFLNIHKWQDAANALKPRRYIEAQLGVIEPGAHIFLTACQIKIKNESNANIIFPLYTAKFSDGTLNIKLTTEHQHLLFEISQSQNRSIFNLFKKQSATSDIYTSAFYEIKGQIIVDPAAPLFIDGEEITNTPVSISLHPKKLKMIISKEYA